MHPPTVPPSTVRAHVKKILDDIWKEWRMREDVARKMKKKKKIFEKIRERERKRNS